jgi:hypothetical protein
LLWHQDPELSKVDGGCGAIIANQVRFEVGDPTHGTAALTDMAKLANNQLHDPRFGSLRSISGSLGL